jgi:hypothetical protein
LTAVNVGDTLRTIGFDGFAQAEERCVVGTVASISMPMALSAALQDAMACTVERWLCTKNRSAP